MLRLNNCDITLKIQGAEYAFTDCNAVEITSQETGSKRRGINNNSKRGFNTKSGTNLPDQFNFTLVNVPQSLFTIMQTAYTEQWDNYLLIFDKKSNEKIICEYAVFTNYPQQNNLSEGDAELTVTVSLEGFTK